MRRKQDRCSHSPQRKTDLKTSTMVVHCSSCGFLFGKVPLTSASVGYGAVVMKTSGVDPKAFEHVWMGDMPFDGSPHMRDMLSRIDPAEIITGAKRVQVDVIEGAQILVSMVDPRD